MLNRIMGQRSHVQGLDDPSFHVGQRESLQQTENTDIFPLPFLAISSLEAAQKLLQGRRKPPIGQRGCLVKGTGLSLQERQIMKRIVDRLSSPIAAFVAGDDLFATGNDNVPHIALYPHVAVTILDRDGIGISLVVHKGR